jgi:hypothetical protein
VEGGLAEQQNSDYVEAAGFLAVSLNKGAIEKNRTSDDAHMPPASACAVSHNQQATANQTTAQKATFCLDF